MLAAPAGGYSRRVRVALGRWRKGKSRWEALQEEELRLACSTGEEAEKGRRTTRSVLVKIVFLETLLELRTIWKLFLLLNSKFS